MYSFKNDYSEGAHPRILEALVKSNLEQDEGYGEDRYSIRAVELLKQKIKRSDIAVHFLSGGTQTNLITISAFLKPYEAVVAANTGHILVHEAGSVEATGHKVISIEVNDGKLKPELIKPVLDFHTDEHMVKPRLVYISNPTEIGSIYTKTELYQISSFCRENNLILFIDGARLGSALCSEASGFELSDLGQLCDAFYIGGTKNGALFGEALVICNDSLKEGFRFHMKQKGALLAKGRVLGIQFLELFKDDLYFELAKHANKMAEQLKEGITSMGYKFLTNSQSNQIFPILPDRVIGELEKKYSFYIWSKVDESSSSIRLVTSWATREDAVFNFIEDLKKL
ncbi:MAG TPA: low specificity L-threonine aldolase [Clostridia bacterium]|nr:low specificity L-threonine aldolase [Clostridia bacterium]